jgi:glycosyltransferase involved in cell wall biosynthesis
MNAWQPQIIDGAARPPGQPLRVLVASHSHPEVSNGGAEIAAFELFRRLRARDDVASWFLGCDRDAGTDKPGAVLSQPFSNEEYIYSAGSFDWFKFANQDPRFRQEIERLFTDLAPDIVHFHHYTNFGVEIFQHLKRVRPDCKIILTLHEYLAICNHYGQMITKGHLNLCYEATPARCQRCFPELGKSDFFLRKLYIERFFGLVDQFVSPSRFLAERYIAWGIPAEKMTVLENLMPEPVSAAAAAPPADGTLRLGFFGQISKLKGIDVLFDAAAMLEKEALGDVTFEIFGDYRAQPAEFQQGFLARLEKAGPNIRFNGPYDRLRVDALMQSVHAVLVPSIWWENSPVVIQEALRNKRPVICSDIGGMAEKVRDGVDGYHFAAGSPVALASLVRQMRADRTMLSGLGAALPGAPQSVSSMADYLAMYRALAGAPAQTGADYAPAPKVSSGSTVS